jgi:hypothetical protein
MAENTGKNPGAAEHAATDRLEQKKQEALEFLLDQSLRFVETDNNINKLVEQLLGVLVQQLQKNPSAVLSNGGDIDALVSALRARSEGGPIGPGVSGGDIVGGLGWSDIVDTIRALEGFLKGEKAFVMDILRLIFCGCKGTGW